MTAHTPSRVLRPGIALPVMALWLAAASVYAGPATATTPSTAPALTVAILDFSSDMPANPDLGRQISDILNVRLSEQAGYTLVERPSLEKALAEMAVNHTIVDTAPAVKLGKLVGARLLVTGKAFTDGKTLYITAKIIGTETTLLDGVLAKGDANANLLDLAVELSDQLADHIRRKGPKLIAADEDAFDPLPALRKKLAGHKLPRLAISINHHQANGAATDKDSAVETELKIVLKETGFTIIEGDARAQAQGAVEVVITGDSVGEVSGRVASLDACSAHAEIKAVRIADNHLLFAARYGARSVDVSQTLAQKSACQKIGHQLALQILEDAADWGP